MCFDIMAVRLTTSDFIAKAITQHGDRYDYTNAAYVNNINKVIIICKTHGEFSQSPGNHLAGHGCPFCKSDKLKQPLMTLESFITKARSIHSDKYNYSQSVYRGSKQPLMIICKIHGAFKQQPNSHLNGRGCPECAYSHKYSNNNRFIVKAKRVHGDKYDYSQVDYINCRRAVIIKCPVHGIFKQKPLYHLRRGCSKCAMGAVGVMQRIDFVKRAGIIHGDKYDYSRAQFIGIHGKVNIICKKHGSFNQSAGNHLYNKVGCPKCGAAVNSSKIQNKLSNDLRRLAAVEINNRSIIPPHEIDVWLPQYTIGVECHGLYWHSDQSELSRYKTLHAKKADMALSSNITLLQFFENELQQRYATVLDIITNKMGISKKIGARSCKTQIISSRDGYDFAAYHHLYGGRYASINLALTYNGDIVQCLSISPHKTYQYEIIRLTSATGLQVMGGAGKLLTYFKRIYSPSSILTFADRRYSTGDVYRQLGFRYLGITAPNYYYYKSNRVYSRLMFQKHKLADRLLIYNPLLSEKQNMFANDYRCFWDAGNLKFLWDKNESK